MSSAIIIPNLNQVHIISFIFQTHQPFRLRVPMVSASAVTIGPENSRKRWFAQNNPFGHEMSRSHYHLYVICQWDIFTTY